VKKERALIMAWWVENNGYSSHTLNVITEEMLLQRVSDWKQRSDLFLHTGL
jgi:hypothetical protein